MSANRARTLIASAVAATTLVAAAPAGAAAPVVDQMVVFKDGSAKVGSVRASATRVKVGTKRCAVGAGTPLAALVRSKAGTVRIHDFGGACGRSPRDAGQLYVRGIGRDIATRTGEDGWVYKVGNKAAPAGAAEPTGPFGRGKLRSRQRVTWFWCDAEPDVEGCQQTLDLKVTANAAGSVTVRVRGYDNAGKGTDIEGATVTAGTATATTDGSGNATLALPPGDHTLVATKAGLVRSFPVAMTARSCDCG